MKKIIIGQLMMIINLATIIIGYHIVKQYLVSGFIEGMLGFVAVMATGTNLFYAIAVQTKGYVEMKIIKKEEDND
tara:strand:+ start:559 stop:783 length:225 start_codon:yes stop_codon:yes gene_type:complete